MPKPLDLNKPLPDEAHDAIRLGVVQALSDLADSFLLVDTLFALQDGARTDIGTGQADLGDSLLLVDTLFDLVDQTLHDLAVAASERDQLRADCDALAARMAAVESALAAPTPPPPEPGA